MSRLELFLRELKLTPKQAGGKRVKKEDVKKRSLRESREKRKEERKDAIQEKRKKERKDAIQEKRIQEQMQEEIQNATIIATQEIQANYKAEIDAENKEREEAKKQRDINNMTTGIETDLGCNVVDDEDEDDENQDNEICKITFNAKEEPYFTETDLTGAKEGKFINEELVKDRPSIGRKELGWRIKDFLETPAVLRNIKRDTRSYMIEEIIYDVIVRLATSKVKVENKIGNFKGIDNVYFSCIYKSNGLVEEILTTFSRYNIIPLTESDILVILFYGVIKPTKINSKKYKVELPKPKLKLIKVGESNTEKFEKVINCKANSIVTGCGLFSDLTTLYGYLNEAQNTDLRPNYKEELIRSVILWFDTHHDFKVDRYDKAKNVWNNKFGGNTFITWYATKFFTQVGASGVNPLGQINTYKFSDEAKNTILKDVVEFSNNLPIYGNLNTITIPTLLEKISREYLQNKDFEKKMLLHYIVHNFNFDGINSTTLLKDILYVNRDTYDKLKNNIQSIIDTTDGNIKKGSRAKLEKLKEFFGDVNGTPTFIFTKPDDLPFFDTNYVKDAGTSSYPLGDDKVQYVPAALFDANKSNTYEPPDVNNTEYDTFILNKIKENNKPYEKPENNRLGNKYEYKRTNCRLEITQPEQQDNKPLKGSDIRCSTKSVIPDDEKIDKKSHSYLIQYLKNKGITDDIFIEKMYDVLLRFISKERNKNVFAIDKSLNLTLPEYFNSIKTGPSVQDLVFLTILHRLNSINTVTNPTGDLPLQLIDNIVNLKRVGDYGQVIDAQKANLPFFTIDSMESLMCIIEKVSCYIDFNQGVIIYDNGKINGIECIRSKKLKSPGYPRRP